MRWSKAYLLILPMSRTERYHKALWIIWPLFMAYLIMCVGFSMVKAIMNACRSVCDSRMCALRLRCNWTSSSNRSPHGSEPSSQEFNVPLGKVRARHGTGMAIQKQKRGDTVTPPGKSVRDFSQLFSTCRYFSQLFATFRNFSQFVATFHNFSLLFVTFRNNSLIFATFRNYSVLFATFRNSSATFHDFSQLFAIVRYFS